MAPTDDSAYRLNHRAAGDDVTIREDLEDDEDTFALRMPIASTGDVRNDGDEPLTRSEIDGMAQQINERQIGVFPAHGSDSKIATGRYSPFERMGDWQDGEVESRSDVDLLMATARMPDPETLPAATGDYREALAILKEQAKRGIAQDSSIGWRDDEDSPGGVDLMEASIVGIGADPRTNTGDESASVAARAAVMGDTGALPEALQNASTVDADELRGLSDQQREIATRVLDSYRDRQGDGEVRDFEGWLWNVAYSEFEDDEFHATMTALESFFRDTTPMDEPVSERFMPFLDNSDTNTQSMSDDDTGDESGTTDGEQNADDDTSTRDGDEFQERMLDMQQQQTEILQSLVDRMDGDGDDEDDEEDDEDEDEDDDEEQSSDPEDTQDADGDDPPETPVIDAERMAELEGQLD